MPFTADNEAFAALWWGTESSWFPPIEEEPTPTVFPAVLSAQQVGASIVVSWPFG